VDGDTLPPGALAGDYQIEARVGRGGMGSVYAAVHRQLGRRAAVKVMAADLGRDPAFVRRFALEAQAIGRARHPNIVEAFSFGQLDDGRCYYAMEWLEGETLEARLARGPLPPGELVAVLDGVAAALAAIHRDGLVHRDITPGNLFLVQGGGVKVTDFGVARHPGAGDLRLTASGMTLGTPTHAAPEQLAGEAVDGRADIYSLGVIGYQMSTGELPFDAARAGALADRKLHETAPRIAGRGGLPASLERLIAAMLDRDPARRPGLAEIRAALARRSRSPLRAVAAGLALAAGVLCAALALGLALSRRQSAPPRHAAPQVTPAPRPISDPAAAPHMIDASPEAAPPPAEPPPPPPPPPRRRASKRAHPRPAPADDPDYLLEPRTR
jgi:eukaryotic-like serine/threonine-protein kinase